MLTSLVIGNASGLLNIGAGNNQLVSLSLTGLTSLVGLDFSNNPLTTVDLSQTPLLASLIGTNCNLTVLSVNTMLTDLAGFSVYGGDLDLSGQTPPAPPSTGPPNGIAAIAILQAPALGWGVVTD